MWKELNEICLLVLLNFLVMKIYYFLPQHNKQHPGDKTLRHFETTVDQTVTFIHNSLCCVSLNILRPNKTYGSNS